MSNKLFINIKSIFGILTGEDAYRLKKGSEMAQVNELHHAYLVVDNGIIADFGGMVDCPHDFEGEIVNCEGQYLIPAWCDSHTHLVFAEGREHEFVLRLQGKTYEEIAAAGGGILNSAEKLQSYSEDALYQSASERLNNVIKFGTGAIEMKSGYGLSFDSELKILRVIQRLQHDFPILVKKTFLGAHAIPKAYAMDRKAYIDMVINDLMPAVIQEGLADYIDVFCDKGFFTVEETDRILKAGALAGLKAKIHANELANSGGVQVGIANKAISVDHLEAIEDREILDLLGSDTIPTVLPSVSYYLNIPYAPARRMIDQGLGIAIASDYNPGSSPSGNMQLLQSIACTKMKLLPKEVFNAITINGACAMEVEHQVGSITVGKLANFCLTKPLSSMDFMAYAFGENHIESVYFGGERFNG